MTRNAIVMPPQPAGAGITSRVDVVTRIPSTCLRSDPPPPRAVKIELTSQCNYRCGYCAHRLRVKPQGEMEWGLYTRLVGEMVDAGVEEVGFFLIGESFMCEWLPEAIAFAKARGIRYAVLTTNGSLATPQKVKRCLESGLDSLKFSMNCADANQFSATAHVKGDLFHDAVANLKAARRMRDEGQFSCGIYASSLRLDAQHQAQMQKVVDEILPYVDEHYWLPLYSTSSANRSLGTIETPAAGKRSAVPLPCWCLFTEGHVTHDGKLSACCFDPGGPWTMADLNEVAFRDGWHSTKFRALREAHLRKDVTGTACENCVAYC